MKEKKGTEEHINVCNVVVTFKKNLRNQSINIFFFWGGGSYSIKAAFSLTLNFVLHTYTFYIVCVVSVIISISCGQKQFSSLTSLHTKIQTKSYHASASLSVPCAHSTMSLINVGSSTISCIHGALLLVLLQDFHLDP
jgi:hypothetical protein